MPVTQVSLLVAKVSTSTCLGPSNLGYMMSHAGVSPEFDFGMAKYYADRVERRLKSPDVSGC